MCMSGPLASQALGRSPYDVVLYGTGHTTRRGPRQQYDERGRPVNAETRRINRSVVRSHNEVMHVIGVAEPDGPSPEAEAEAAEARRHLEFENYIGRNLALVSDVLVTAGVWGVNGVRQRILIYKEYAHVPFHGLHRLQRSRQSVPSYLGSGLPSFLASLALEELNLPHLGRLHSTVERFSKPICTYLRLHFEIFTFLQRVGLASSSAIFPNWKFFIPGSSLSPIYIPAAPQTLSAQSIVQWLGASAMGAVPFAGYYCFSEVSRLVTIDISRRVLKHLPRTPAVDSAVENGRDISRPEPPSSTPNGLPTSAGIPTPYGLPTSAATPTTPTRRASAVAIGSEDFVSDDEDEEGVSTTFISFDVEPTTTTDPSPAVWSAELRQNVAEGAVTEGQEPVYRDSNLVRLPPLLAADVFGGALARIFLAPHESQVWLGLARLFASRQGLPLDGFHEFGFRQVGVLRMMVNAVGVEMLFFMLRCEIWGLITLLAHLGRFDEAEWIKVSGPEEKEEA
ncbi:hypothetical protein B0T18DRAFT_363273 [Schizothecium vesticola]|uniref:Uncharacterized protein n=1 Tax=Schizothecium vesticola TaxID=314040 RepID=A0AA40F6V1_9PEZI|nr:hypothetical protein B0T18DRAFT_363273 [Schizothecium vesticola]